MKQRIIMALFALSLSMGPVGAQTDSFTKNFKYFKNVATNVDFYAANSSEIAPFEKPLREARQSLESFIGKDLTRGAIVICSSLEQKDALNEQRILKMGYKWIITQLTSEATAQQMLAQIKAQSGGQLPPGILERMQNRTPEMKAAGDARMVNSTIQRAAFAMLSTTLSPEKEFRASRLDDMGRSPLADWLDVGLTSYAIGPSGINYRFLQDHLEEVFPIEDLLSMSRPFVAPGDGGAGGGGQFVMRIGGQGGGAPPASGAAPPQQAGGGNRTGGGFGGQRMGGSMPKDVQDRMTFDAQAASFFAYASQKLGIDKAREVIQWNRDGKLTREALMRPGFLGTDLDAIERDWQSWVKAQKMEAPPNIRIINAGPQKPGGPS